MKNIPIEKAAMIYQSLLLCKTFPAGIEPTTSA